MSDPILKAQSIAMDAVNTAMAKRIDDRWDVCHCDHYRAEHSGDRGQCMTIVITCGGREHDCVCRAFRFARKSRR